MKNKVPNSPLLPTAKYELAYARQNQKKTNEAIQLYSEVAEEQRNEIGARSRFMMGEVFFADREFAKAISEFQRATGTTLAANNVSVSEGTTLKILRRQNAFNTNIFNKAQEK